jgi:UDP-N-acetylglucosamine pyrophosphorylase
MSNTKMLERDFGLIEYVKERARDVIKEMDSKAILDSDELLIEYITKGKTSYMRKIMRLDQSEVLKLPIDELHKNITDLPRWKGKIAINPETKKIELNSSKHVESFIDLLDERYTRSDVTQQEYYTSARKKAK